ncbi:ribosomal protein S5 domain 2-type protein [Lipomyces oligophaga]|uniref:ribosomal protein S5 domain 2-type protein n=1 Tax=Lipomyces oligophaga TaxID=45792 RepID=UPI0034CD12EA
MANSPPRKFIIKVPCSSANLGPGFDVVGLALSVYLELTVEINAGYDTAPQNCLITCEGEGAADLPLEADANLITRTALYVLRCHDIRTFPATTTVHINNQIPLGRGLGSSGAAVVAGVMLGNAVGQLGLSKDRMMDYSLMIERHPDNVTAAMMGGLVGSFLCELNPEDMERKEIPLAEVLPEPAGGLDTGLMPPKPPFGIGTHIKIDWAPEIKAIAIIPAFELSTASSRGVLPSMYNIKDLVFNLQRVVVLTIGLSRSPPNADLIYQAMQDRVHQPYRTKLIPGLTDVLASVTPSTDPGLLGICLSGAGPTILALATHNYDHIASSIISKLNAQGVQCSYKVLSPAFNGAECIEN